MLARVKATGEIVEVYERYDDLAMESTYTELARIYHPDELDLDHPGRAGESAVGSQPRRMRRIPSTPA